MSKAQSVSCAEKSAVMLSFCDRFPSSPQFNALYREGMALVDETAHYLDGQGRKDSQRLSPPVSQAYTTETMRLTTRLMQLASWLLIRRAVSNGEVTPEDVRNHKRRVRLIAHSSIRAEGYDQLPSRLRYLIEESDRLHSRVLRLDHMMEGITTIPPAYEPPVGGQIQKLRLAFSAD